MNRILTAPRNHKKRSGMQSKQKRRKINVYGAFGYFAIFACLSDQECRPQSIQPGFLDSKLLLKITYD